MANKPDNVIPFPGDRKPKDKEQSEPKPTLFYDFERNKVMISASIVTVLAVVTLFNGKMNGLSSQEVVQTTQMGRSIASVERDSDWEETMARQLASTDTPPCKSCIGRKPSALEELYFGQLAGNYSMQFMDGKVDSIQYNETENSIPKYVNDRELFLEKNRKLLSVSFDNVRQESSNREAQGQLVEVYNLESGDQPAGKVQFEMDPHGRFISMKVQKRESY